jgi:PTS system nitrogen regulatory IIA component
MHLTDILSERRVLVDVGGSWIANKNASLTELGKLIAPAVGLDERTVSQLLVERERIQSTGIGDGVAIPHASTDQTVTQVAALLICPSGIDFDSMDSAPVRIIFGVIGPRRAPGEHLKALARISRLLRVPANREHLIECKSATDAFELVRTQDATF